MISIDGGNSELQDSKLTEDTARRVVKGVFALGVRQIFVHGANVLGENILVRLRAQPTTESMRSSISLFCLQVFFGGSRLAAAPIGKAESILKMVWGNTISARLPTRVY
jgi:hypothetical protein